MESLKKKNYKPEKLFALVIITIFVAEFGLMILLQYLFVPTPPIENLLDATILVIVVYPVLYKYFFKPTLLEIKRRQDAEQRLLQYTKELENITFTLNDEKDRLAKNNAKDEAILESMGEGMVAVDNDRKVMFVNKFATEMLGWNTKELIGKELTHLPLEDEAGNPVPLNKRPTTIALATGNITKVSYFFVRKDKTKFPIAITATPIKLKGEILGLIEIIRDITEEREIDKAKSEFISFASHQLKTPLTAIKFLTERLLTGKMGALAEKQEEYLSDIRSSNQRMII